MVSRAVLNGWPLVPGSTYVAPVIAPLAISGAPPAATVGTSPVSNPAISGGVPPYTLSVFSGTLAPGRSLSGLTIVGTYTTAGTFNYVLRVTDSVGSTANLPVSVVVSAPGVTLPTPTSLMAFGDSRLQKSASFTSSGATYSQNRNYSGGFLNALEAAIDYKVLSSDTGVYAVGASTTRNGTLRLNSTSNAATGSTASTDTGDSADAAFNSNATGQYSPISDPANIVFHMYGTNDGSYATYFDTPKKSMLEIAGHLNAFTAANKVVFLANETPRGRSFIQNEVKAVSSLACQTTGNTAVSVRRLRNRETGAAYTKVSSLTATGQYTVSAAGAVAFFTGDTITNAQIDYDSGNTTSGVYLNTLHNWLGSNAANFVDPDSGVDYGIPGALYNRPLVFSVDSWGALKKAGTSGANTINAEGTLSDGLHTNTYGATLVGAAFKTAFNAAYPSLTRQDKQPTKNSYVFGTGNAALTTFSGTLPTIGMVPVPTGKMKVIAAAVSGVDNGSGVISGSGVSGTVNYSTGAVSLTFTTAPANGVQIEVSTDLGANLIDNGLFDPAHGAGTVTPTGVTGSPPKGWGLTVDTDLQSAITAGTVTVSLDTSQANPDTGLSALRYNVRGAVGGTAGTIGNLTSPNSVRTPVNRVLTSPGDKIRAGLQYRILPGPGGTVQGLIGVQAKGQPQSTTAVTRKGALGAADNTGVTIASATSGGGASGTPFDDQDLVSGVFKSPLLTTPIDCSGMTFNSIQHNVILQYEKAKWLDFTVEVSQASLQVTP